MTDEGLIEQAASGDETAFAVIYERHHGLVFRFAYRLSQSRETETSPGALQSTQ
jgi:DNA-directed RNA polymerase specialized sigma24 family protein